MHDLVESRVGRLAPTPSGYLHLGNALAFGATWLSARTSGARLLLRVEDGDPQRSRGEVLDALHDDLAWLGIDYDEEVPPQSQRDHASWLPLLPTYRCICTRRLLQERPCTCGEEAHEQGAVRWRLRPGPVRFVDRRFGPQRIDPTEAGDPVLVNREGVASYLLRVVVDDLVDGVTEVVRGGDLLDHTAVQVRLWEELGATPPSWLHAPLLQGADGRKLGKSHGSTEIRALRARGVTAEEVWERLLPWLGCDGASRLEEAVGKWTPVGGPLGPLRIDDPRLG
jgi:glutamyl/glutaminyl-tRNA synthetase